MSRRRSLVKSVGDSLANHILDYWPLSSNSNDSVGSNDGTDTSMSYTTGGIIDNCADFTAGTSSVITIADDDSLSFPLTPFSFSCWYKRNSGASWELFSKRESTNFEYRLLQLAGSGYMFRLFDGGSNSDYIQVVDSGLSLPTGVWINVAGSSDGSGTKEGLTLFVNGTDVSGTRTEVGTFSSMLNTSASVTMGKFNNSTGFSLDGYMCECYLYNIALSDDIAAYIYSEGLAGRTLI